MRRKIMYAALIAGFICLAQTSQAANQYGVVELKGSVNPVLSEYIVKSIQDASDRGLQFIVIQMDTPGGFMEPMKEIIKAILNSPIPVVVYTYPKGAQAASAGGFIMISAHIAAMSPGTEIGAMHPVSPMLDFLKKDKEGNPEGPMEKKVLNDTIAFGKSLAQERGRNVNWVIDAVKNAKSSTFNEALRAGVIDIVADDMNDLLAKINNRTVTIKNKKITLSTRDIAPYEYRMDWKQKFVNYLADPQVIFILFIIAVAGIGIEFKSPGMIVPGTIGGIALILFLLGIKVISINIMGLMLLILAIVLFILEFKLTSYGILAVAGIAAFIAGAMMLFDSPLQGGFIPFQSIIGAALVLFGFMFLLIKAVMKAFKNKVSTGEEGLIGEEGSALDDFKDKGKVLVHGEIWNAVTEDALKKGDTVKVVRVNGMELVVKLLDK